MYKRASQSWMKHLDFILIDFLCIQISFLMAYAIRIGSLTGKFYFAYDSQGYRMLGIVVTILHFCIVFFTSHYSGIMRRGPFAELLRVISHNVLLIAGLFSYLILIKQAENASRAMLLIFLGLNIFLMFAMRTLKKSWMLNRNFKPNKRRHIVIVSTSEEITGMIDTIKKMGNWFNIVGIALITDTKVENGKIEDIPVIAYTSEETYEYACRNIVDEVFIYIPNSNNTATGEIANVFLQMGITVHINLDMLSSGMPNVAVEKLGDYTVMTTAINSVTPLEAFIKRMIDIVAGLVGCIITGILFIFIAPAIKLADKGPVFFKQERAGKNGRTFNIYKFRSMYVDAEERKKELMKQNKMEGLMFKMDADPRIIGSGPDGTRKGLGYWMRTLSLDEFPNFYSILKGDMSLVGTRPPTMDEFVKYSLHHKGRLSAKPGLTGMWQISGRSDMTNFEEIVEMDTEYIKNWSLGLDIKIIIKTFLVVMKRKGSI